MSLLLLAHILVVPPYEGFDETAHYSYISHLADRREVPRIGEARFDLTLSHDRAWLPRPYSTVPPFEDNGGLTYQEFYEELPDSTRTRAVGAFWSPRASRARFEQDPQTDLNGAASHPPLYYALMTLPYRWSADWSPGASHLLLRSLSVALTCASWIVFWFTIRLFADPELRWRLLGGGALALHSPGLVFEFGRIGNDSLVVLLFAATFYFLVRLTRTGMQNTRDFALLGLVLGLGLITKLFFIATLGGVVLHIAYYTLLQQRSLWRSVAKRTAVLIGVALLIGGWWYILFRMRYGVLFGTHLTLAYGSPETVDVGFVEFALRIVRMFASAVSSFIWSGSWSFLRRTASEYLLCAPFFLLALGAFVRGWKQQNADDRLALTASSTLLVPLVAGTVWYMLDAIRHGVSVSVVGGYYWLVAWPALAVIYSSLFVQPWARRFLPAALSLLVLFELSGWWKQLLLYAGILVKQGIEKSGVGFVLPGMDVAGEVLGRLGGLGWPMSAVATILVAFVLRELLVYLSWRRYTHGALGRSPSASAD